jgi:hypothetical protein
MSKAFDKYWKRCEANKFCDLAGVNKAWTTVKTGGEVEAMLHLAWEAGRRHGYHTAQADVIGFCAPDLK